MVQKKSKFFKAAVTAILVFVAIFTIYLVLPLSYSRLEPDKAYRFFDRNGEILAMLPAKDGYVRIQSQVKKLPKLFVDALLAKEDRFFFNHPGVNVFSLVRAIGSNVREKRIVSGASTITMQLARMLDRKPRTYFNKIREAFLALKLEVTFSKDEILSLYLANAPYGGRIEGVEAASFRYFRKKLSDLSIAETALLVAIPRSPNRLRPDRHPERAKSARNLVLKVMREQNIITSDKFERALSEPIKVESGEVQNYIPHLAYRLKSQDPRRFEWKLSIDKNLQMRALSILRNYVSSLTQYNITNASTVILDNQTREVRVYVGSTDYRNADALGANDGVASPRSPGSTLKPFVYALAADAGLISEKSILYDVPVNYGGYSPENYSKNFVGLITAKEALIDSLNVVAVNLSYRLGVDRLYTLLKRGGVSSLTKESSYYGLPLVLGGVEVSLLELANLYTAFANKGRYAKYGFFSSQTANNISLFSSEAAWLISYFMQDVERPDFPESWRFSRGRPTVSWKTGTSYAHQDAWSVGFTNTHTVGVWVGNFDGSQSIGLAGSKTAAPLFFEIIQGISKPQDRLFMEKPHKVKSRLVCETCGRPKGLFCKNMVKELYIEREKSGYVDQVCDVPQEILVNGVPKIYNVWPSEVSAYLLKHGYPVREVPPYQIGQMAGEKYYAPKILNPVENTTHFQRLDKLARDEHSIKLSAAVTNRVRKVSWYLNEKLIAQVDPIEDVLINPDPGEYTLSLVDEVGGRDQVKLIVKDYRERSLDESLSQ